MTMDTLLGRLLLVVFVIVLHHIEGQHADDCPYGKCNDGRCLKKSYDRCPEAACDEPHLRRCNGSLACLPRNRTCPGEKCSSSEVTCKDTTCAMKGEKCEDGSVGCDRNEKRCRDGYCIHIHHSCHRFSLSEYLPKGNGTSRWVTGLKFFYSSSLVIISCGSLYCCWLRWCQRRRNKSTHRRVSDTRLSSESEVWTTSIDDTSPPPYDTIPPPTLSAPPSYSDVMIQPGQLPMTDITNKPPSYDDL